MMFSKMTSIHRNTGSSATNERAGQWRPQIASAVLAGFVMVAIMTPVSTHAVTGALLPLAPSSVAETSLIVVREAASPVSIDAGKLSLPVNLAQSMARASDRTGVDLKLLISVAHRESAFKAKARARTSSATGLYQFIDSTWLSAVRQFGADHGLVREASYISESGAVDNSGRRACILGLRNNPDLAAAMAAEMLRHDATYLEGALSRNPTDTDLYAAHFLGVRKAAQLAAMAGNKPQVAAAKMFPRAARANKSIFYQRNGRRLQSRTVKAVYDRLALPYAEEADVMAKQVRRIFGDVNTAAGTGDVGGPAKPAGGAG